MRLPEKINPVHCASKDGTRYVLNSVSIQGDLAIATDGRCLFAVKGSREDDDDARDALIPKRVAIAAWPKRRGTVLPMLIIDPVAENKQTTCTVMNADLDKTTAKDIDGKFPDIEKVLPDVAKYTQRVGLNAKILLQLVKSFGEDEIVIHFSADGWRDGMQDQPMMITSKTCEAFGILMPLRTTGYGLNANHALGSIKHRIKRREAEEQAAREASIAAAQAIVEAERAEAAAKAEADAEKTAAWLAIN